jgi:hypothetical protein
MNFQFFFARDYSCVYNRLEAMMGEPFQEYCKRVSGLLGPTTTKTTTTLWQGIGYSLELRSDPGGNGISVLKFAAATYWCHFAPFWR